MRNTYSLNFDWLFIKKEGEKDIFTYDDAVMETVHIPHSNVVLPYNNFSETLYQFESVYKKHFTLKKQKDKRYFIEFEGVLHKSNVYLNNNYIGSHQNGYTAFQFEITEHLNDLENTLIVEVDSRETLNQPPFGKTIDFLTYGGIYREVTITETPLDYIKDVTIHTSNVLDNPEVNIDVQVTKGKQIDVEIYDDTDLILSKSFAINDEVVINYPFELWDINNPKLYRFVMTLDGNDHVEITTGIREIKFEKNGFFLNGNKVKITGLNRHQIYPHVGYAMPKSAQVKDAEILRTLGNAVRTSHYPHSKHFLDACDRLGLLVFSEAPGWQHIGDDEWKNIFIDSVKDMIQKEKYHPSIILWGVRVNESGDDNSLYTTTNALAKELDQRPTGGVRCFSFSEALEDVYTYNDFFHNGTNNYLKDIDEILDSDKPYLITEFNGHMFPTKSFDPPSKQVEHALRYAHILNDINGSDRIAGGFGWQFIDYFTHSEFGSGDHICYHGVLDTFRLPKPAGKLYQSQEATTPYLEILHSTDIGDYDTSYIDMFYVATNCDYLDLYQNNGYVKRFYPDKDTFPNLAHPPIIIDDFYGDAYELEGIKKEDSYDYIKYAHLAASRGGLDKLTKHDDIDYKKLQKGWQMYGKYIANWGSEAFTYTLEGHYKDEVVKRTIGPYVTYDYRIKADSNELIIDETYDVTRVTIEAIDNNGNIRNYAFDPFILKATGSIEIIGDQLISLIGGKRAIWVKSICEGYGKLEITNEKSTNNIVFKVLKK